MSHIVSLFPSEIYHGPLSASVKKRQNLNREILKDAERIQSQDDFGKRWSKDNYSHGYTSYSSHSELHKMSSTFLALKEEIDVHVRRYARSLDMDLKSHPLEITQMWVNIMDEGCFHAAHIHPLSSISGTYYVACPRGSGDIKFEDPRLTQLMASLPRIEDCRQKNKRFVSVQPREGDLVLFESWMRHEVLPKKQTGKRVSVSFNYNWF